MTILENRPESAAGTVATDAARSVADPGFLLNVWYVAGWASEFAGPGPFARRIADRPVVFYRPQTGRLAALADRCAHRWAPLSLGRVEGDALRCMYHGVKFGADGRCVEVPDQDNIAEGLAVHRYPVVERHRLAWIWLGDEAAARDDLIPTLTPLDQPGWRYDFGSLDYAASYALISDNLLDLSHVKFSHEKTFGQTPPALNGANAFPIERGVRMEGWVSGDEFGEGLRQFQPDSIKVDDSWGRIEYTVPGIFHSFSKRFPAGTAAACDRRPPGPEHRPLAEFHSVQAVTPISARASRYFFSGCYTPGPFDDATAAAQWQVALAAFQEDLVMIEAQQRVIDETPGERMAGIAADRGLTIFRRLMGRLIEADTPARP